MKEKLNEFSSKWKMLSHSQRFSLLGIITPLLILPLTLYLVANSTNLVSDAKNNRFPVSPPETNSVPVILTEEMPLSTVGRNYQERIENGWYRLELACLIMLHASVRGDDKIRSLIQVDITPVIEEYIENHTSEEEEEKLLVSKIELLLDVY